MASSRTRRAKRTRAPLDDGARIDDRLGEELGRMHRPHRRQLGPESPRVGRPREALAPHLVTAVALELLEDLATLGGIARRPGEAPPLGRPVYGRGGRRPVRPGGHDLGVRGSGAVPAREAEEAGQRQRGRQPPRDAHAIDSTRRVDGGRSQNQSGSSGRRTRSPLASRMIRGRIDRMSRPPAAARRAATSPCSERDARIR